MKGREKEKSVCVTSFNQLMLILTSRRTQTVKEETHQESGTALGQSIQGSVEPPVMEISKTQLDALNHGCFLI